MEDGQEVTQVGALYIMHLDFLLSLRLHLNLVTVASWFYLVHFGQISYLFSTFQKDTE